MASTNSLMFVELLLWKTSKDCYELEMGYGTLERERLERGGSGRRRAVDILMCAQGAGEEKFCMDEGTRGGTENPLPDIQRRGGYRIT